MKRGKSHTLIALLTLIAAALTGNVASAGELESIWTPDLCGRDRNFAYQMLERMNEELDTINHATMAYQMESENSQAALEYWKKRQNSPVERILLGPDTDDSLKEKITIAAALKENAEQKKTRLAGRAQTMRRQLNALEKALNADECPWAPKKQGHHMSAEYAASTIRDSLQKSSKASGGNPAGSIAASGSSDAFAQRAE